jgi:hypothetical protein
MAHVSGKPGKKVFKREMTVTESRAEAEPAAIRLERQVAAEPPARAALPVDWA